MPLVLWPPTDVEPIYRKRATALWMFLVGGFFAYIIYLCNRSWQQSKTPPTTYSLKEEAFPIPDVGVCFLAGFGCPEGFEANCTKTVPSTGSKATLVSSPDGPFVPATIDYEGFPLGTCILMEASKLPSDEPFTSIFVQVAWLPSLGTNTTVTLEQVQVNFYDPSQPASARSKQTNIQFLGYGALPPGAGSTTPAYVPVTNVVLEATHRKTLSGSNKWTYGGTFTSGVSNTGGVNNLETEIALLFLQVHVTNAQYTEIAEINTLSPAVILGAIGGFWGYVLGIFGLFFVPIHRGEVAQTLRPWRNTLQRGMDLVLSFRKGGTVVDATAGGLPPGWREEQDANGHTYYLDDQGRRWELSPQTSGVLDTAELGQVPPTLASPHGRHNGQLGGVSEAFEQKTDSEGQVHKHSSNRKTAEPPVQQGITEPRSGNKVLEMTLPRRTSSHSCSGSVLSEEESKEGHNGHLCPPRSPEPPGVQSLHENAHHMPAGWQEVYTPKGSLWYKDLVNGIMARERPTMSKWAL